MPFLCHLFHPRSEANSRIDQGQQDIGDQRSQTDLYGNDQQEEGIDDGNRIYRETQRPPAEMPVFRDLEYQSAGQRRNQVDDGIDLRGDGDTEMLFLIRNNDEKLQHYGKRKQDIIRNGQGLSDGYVEGGIHGSLGSVAGIDPVIQEIGEGAQKNDQDDQRDIGSGRDRIGMIGIGDHSQCQTEKDRHIVLLKICQKHGFLRFFS